MCGNRGNHARHVERCLRTYVHAYLEVKYGHLVGRLRQRLGGLGRERHHKGGDLGVLVTERQRVRSVALLHKRVLQVT